MAFRNLRQARSEAWMSLQTYRRKGLATSASRPRSDRVDRRAPAGPRSGGFELTRETKERRLVTVPACDQDADRDPVVGPVERDRHGGLPGDVRDRVPRVERVVEALPGDCAADRLVQDTERLRPLRQRRREPHVVGLEEPRELARRGTERRDRFDEIDRGER